MEDDDFDVEGAQKRITGILNYMSENKPDFDDHFVQSLSDQLDRKGKLSDQQIAALDRIIGGFKIDVDEWCD